MKSKLDKCLFWTPRILGLLFSLLMFSFLLEGFVEDFKWYYVILAMVPGLIALMATLIAWKWELHGGILFIPLGILYIAMAWNKFPPITYLGISGPLVLTGALFLAHKFKTAKAETSP